MVIDQPGNGVPSLTTLCLICSSLAAAQPQAAHAVLAWSPVVSVAILKHVKVLQAQAWSLFMVLS